MEESTDFQEPDEARPAKRVRLEAPLEITQEVQEEVLDNDDWDDIYGLTTDGAAESTGVSAANANTQLQQLGERPDSPAPAHTLNVPASLQPDVEPAADTLDDASSIGGIEGGVPVDAIGEEDGLVVEQGYGTTTNGLSAQVLEETTRVEAEPPYKIERTANGEAGGTAMGSAHAHTVDEAEAHAAEDANRISKVDEDTATSRATNGDAVQSNSKPNEDAEFLEAAAGQKGNEQAEWQFDSSDAESSSDSDSSDDDSGDDDSGSEGGYEMLDPAAAAKLLMAGDGDDEDNGKGKDKSGADRQPRTANEMKEEVVPKPDVVITEDMQITHLGSVDRIFDNLLLIKAVTPGEYRVLESGSVLCTENREVVGAVADTIGRVQEPIYSVAFTNAKEIEDAGYEHGMKVFYVDSHSKFVFTQPLKNMKGTDASNIHDEEAGEDEIEFSDDEKEAEFKRMKKLAKKEGRGGLSRGAFNEERVGVDNSGFGFDGRGSANGNDAPQQQYGGGLSYDDVDVQDEFYSPLKRPDNLSQMMASGGPPRPDHAIFDRGRGRGRGRGDRGRGRNDRGRGRGNFDQRNQRGGRGNYGHDRGGHAQQNGHRGNAHSFPDRHNDSIRASSSPRQDAPSSKPNRPRVSPRPQNQQQQQQQYPTYQQYPPQQATSPQTYQFNGYTFQYGNPPPQASTPQTAYFNPHPQQQQQQAHSPGGSIPAGAYVNPAFFQNQQQQQQSQKWSPPQQVQQPNYGGWQQQAQQNMQAAYGAPVAGSGNWAGAPVPLQQQQQQQQNNLADILRQLGGPQR